MSKRIFLAFDVPAAVVKVLKKYCDRELPVRWISPENLHVTLNFLGNVEDDRLEEVFEITAAVAKRHPKADLKVETVRPHGSMIWAQIARTPQLYALHEDLLSEFTGKGLGEPQRKHLSPHINLARGKSPLNSDQVSSQPVGNVRFEGDRIVVFQSRLFSEGPVYESLDSFELTG